MEHESPIPFNSPFTGELHPITDAPDEAFAQKMTGDGFFVYPEENTVYAPCDSEVTFVFDTRHAIGLTAADGTEYLLHIGINTVRLQGKGFTVFAESGQHVKKGDRLLTFDKKLICACSRSCRNIGRFGSVPAPASQPVKKPSASSHRHLHLRSLIFSTRLVQVCSILFRKHRIRSIPINLQETVFLSIRLNPFCMLPVTDPSFLFLKKKMPSACIQPTDWSICCRSA